MYFIWIRIRIVLDMNHWWFSVVGEAVGESNRGLNLYFFHVGLLPSALS